MCVLNCFNALILKNKKNIILIYFSMKNILKNNHKNKIFLFFFFSFQKKMVSLGLIKPIAANSFSMN
jgi:hypothetical protein